MQLSVVIPCFNMEQYLAECLDSLFKQELKLTDFEVIVVNDGSTDNTLKVAEAYATKFFNVKIIDKQNAGVGAARNSGLDVAKGTYIYFLDPDDYLAKNTLPKLVAAMDNFNLEIITFNSKSVNEKSYLQSSDIHNPTHQLKVKDGISYIADKKHNNEIWWFITNRSFLVKTKVRFIEGRWMEDAILTSQLFCKADRIAHFDRDIHRYRILPTSAMRNKSPEHYKKVIYDNANAAHVYNDLINTVPKSHPKAKKCIKRLKTRQQSFVFFLMVRLMKSDISIKKIPEMLNGFKRIDAYPLDKFLGEDYHGIGYSFLVYIFNRRPLINPFIRVFRTIYNFVK